MSLFAPAFKKTCPKCKGLCDIQVIVTAAPAPKNLRVGCAEHGYWLKECFETLEEAVNAWNTHNSESPDGVVPVWSEGDDTILK